MGDIQVVLWLSRWFMVVSFDSVALFLHPSKSNANASILLFFILVSVLFSSYFINAILYGLLIQLSV